MSLISKLTVRLKRHPKRVVFPEGSDPRILQAARQFASNSLGVPILLGDRAKIKCNAEKLTTAMFLKFCSIGLQVRIKSYSY